jgi:hypothetical protein
MLPALRSTLARRSAASRAGILFDTCLAFTFYSRRTFEGVKMRLGVRQGGRCLTRVFNERCLTVLDVSLGLIADDFRTLPD